MGGQPSRRQFLETGAGLAAGALLGGSRAGGEEPPAPAADPPTQAPQGQSPLDRVVIEPSTLVGKEGFFRVGKSTKGRWWLIRSDGKPFLYRGVCALWMPAGGPGSEALAFRQHWEEKNGKDEEKLIAHCLGILRDLGFNALGEWATPIYYNRGWPYTVLIHVRQVRKESNLTPKHPDIFCPLWEKAYDARCRELCTPLADKKDLVGYFVDNEGGWAQARRDFVWGQDAGPLVDRNVLGKEPLLLQMFLTADPQRPAHKAAWDWVLARHGGNVKQLASDWGADFDSPAKLRELHDKGLALASKAFGVDQDAFTTYFVQEYYRKTAEAIRRHDPNHLLLGCRYGGPPGEVVMKSYDRRHVDVVSFNNYRTNFKERADEYYKHTQMPMLNGEFSWASGGFVDWNKLQARKSFGEEERETCRRKGTTALEEAFTHPGLVGYTWYKFCYRFPSPDDPTYGLIDPSGQRSRFNEQMFRKIHPRLEAIACGELEPGKA